MRNRLTDEHQDIRDLVRRVAADKVASRAADIDARAEYPQDMFDLLRDLGLFTLPFPEHFGGRNSILGACIAIKDLGQQFSLWRFSLHCGLSCWFFGGSAVGGMGLARGPGIRRLREGGGP